MRELLVSGKEKSDLLPVLKTVNQWVCWSYSNHPLKSDKVPIDTSEWNAVKKQFEAKAYHDPEIWLSYEQAYKLMQEETVIDGIGFVLLNIQISFVDIDDCINEMGQVTNEVYQIVQDSESYAEISPSGSGIHILIQGDSPAYGTSSFSDSAEIEIYDGSWVTVTQRHISRTPPEIRRNAGFTRDLCERYDIRRPPDW